LTFDRIPPIVLSKCVSVLCKPLHHLFCYTLKYGYLPSEWKLHKIIPVFKSGDHAQVKNYHPISLLSNISKVLERMICNKIILITLLPSSVWLLTEPLSNSYPFYQMYSMIVISLMSSIWIFVKPSTRFLILTYLPNFLPSTLVVKFGCGFRPTSLIGDSIYLLTAAILIYSWWNLVSHKAAFWVPSYLSYT